MAANIPFYSLMTKEVFVKSIFQALALTSILCALPEFAHATPPCSACGILHAPAPEIGAGVIGFAVAAVILFTALMLPRIKRLLRTKTV